MYVWHIISWLIIGGVFLCYNQADFQGFESTMNDNTLFQTYFDNMIMLSLSLSKTINLHSQLKGLGVVSLAGLP